MLIHNVKDWDNTRFHCQRYIDPENPKRNKRFFPNSKKSDCNYCKVDQKPKKDIKIPKAVNYWEVVVNVLLYWQNIQEKVVWNNFKLC